MGKDNKWGDIPTWSHGAIHSLLETLKTVDPMTHAHCLRVGEYARRLARDAGLNEYEQSVAHYSGILHDIGKMAIDKSILHKPGRLTGDEMNVMKSHPVVSEQIVKPLAQEEFFAHLLPGIRAHHERIDGGGYPDGLMGDQIPLTGRIVLIVDTLDAMSENRSYRRGLPIEMVYAELKKCSGSQFDEQLVKIFLTSHRFWSRQKEDEVAKEQQALILQLAKPRRAAHS